MRPPQNQEVKGASAPRDKLIRLDDLIPEKDVKGGQQVPFGVTDTTQRQTTQTNKIDKKNGTEKREQNNRLQSPGSETETKMPRWHATDVDPPLVPQAFMFVSRFLDQKTTAPHAGQV